MGKKRNNSKGIVIAVCILMVVAAVAAFLLWQGQAKQAEKPSFEQSQSEYVQPEVPVDRSKSIALPGWSSFDIPANTKSVDRGFEFHNPAENIWYEDSLSVAGGQPETLVVDSGEAVELNHYLSLAHTTSTVTSVESYDAGFFAIGQNEAGAYTVQAIAGFEGEKVIEVSTSEGKQETITVSCTPECYYMTFGLYLDETDELLYQSGLVAPGKYLQHMELSRGLEPGTYAAYVVYQPYKSDQETKTNQGVVRITLNVQ